MATSDLGHLSGGDEPGRAPQLLNLIEARVADPAPTNAYDDLLVVLNGQKDGPVLGWRPDDQDRPPAQGDIVLIGKSTRGRPWCLAWERQG